MEVLTVDQELTKYFKKQYDRVFKALNYQILYSEQCALLNLLKGNGPVVHKDSQKESEYSERLHMWMKTLLRMV